MCIRDSIGTVQMANGYEYGLAGKFNIRTSTAQDCVFQLYGFGGTASSFNAIGQSGQNTFFQMGVQWVGPGSSSVLTSQTNSMNISASAPAAGTAAWFQNAGYGTTNWYFENGYGNATTSPGTANLESTQSVTWTGQTITIVIKSDSASSNARKVAVFVGDTQVYKYNGYITAGASAYIYIGIGYVTSANNYWQAGLPKFRYAALNQSINVA